jgi:signal transduction histidine kinase
VLRELDADEGSLLLLTGDEAPVLTMLAARGLPEEIVRRGYVQRKGSISEYVLNERKPIIINDAVRTPDYESIGNKEAVPRRIVSALCVPLITHGKVLGTLNLNRTHGRELFGQDALAASEIVASQAAMVIENHRLHEDMERQERLAAIGQVITSVSHCVKNILSGVRGGLGLAEMGLRDNDPERISQGCGMLRRNAGLLSNLVLDLLDYSKERKPMREPFSVNRTLADVVDTVDYKANYHGVTVAMSAETEISFYGDRDQLLRAVLNLAMNAVEACISKNYTGETGRVDLGCRVAAATSLPISPSQASVAEGWLVIEVADNGPGIPEEAQHSIWELFFSTKGSKGTGIGLASARKTILEHGGHLLLNSVAGCGATFTAFLPMFEKERAPDELS